MSDRAARLGIPKDHLLRALVLARDLRAQTLREGLDPRATRIAILFLERVDTYYAVRRLKHPELKILGDIADQLYEENKPQEPLTPQKRR